MRDKKRYIRMTIDGTSCICEPREVAVMINDFDGEGATLTEVWMTEAEYEALPEFTGW